MVNKTLETNADSASLRRHRSARSFALHMRTCLLTPTLLLALLTASCRTEKPTEATVAAWQGSQVFVLPQEGGFQSETLELKDERFRYWFSSDVIVPNRPNYPIEGSYEFRDERLILSSGEIYTVRPLRGIRTLWKPSAVDYWDRHQVIDVYGILLPVENISSQQPTLEPLFTKEQWNRSREQVRQLEQKK